MLVQDFSFSVLSSSECEKMIQILRTWDHQRHVVKKLVFMEKWAGEQ